MLKKSKYKILSTTLIKTTVISYILNSFNTFNETWKLNIWTSSRRWKQQRTSCVQVLSSAEGDRFTLKTSEDGRHRRMCWNLNVVEVRAFPDGISGRNHHWNEVWGLGFKAPWNPDVPEAHRRSRTGSFHRPPQRIQISAERGLWWERPLQEGFGVVEGTDGALLAVETRPFPSASYQSQNKVTSDTAVRLSVEDQSGCGTTQRIRCGTERCVGGVSGPTSHHLGTRPRDCG